MSFTFMDIVTILSFCIATVTLAFGIIKFVSVQIHGRITGVEKKYDDEIKDIKDNYAHKESIESGLRQINQLVSDMKTEQHRMSQRMDDFVKWLMQLQANRDSK